MPDDKPAKQNNRTVFTVDLEQASQLTFSERLLLKLNSSDTLEEKFYLAGEKIAERGSKPVFGHVIIAGLVIARGASGTFEFGPGSVFGVAEGLSDMPIEWEIIAKGEVKARLIPTKRAVTELRALNTGLLGICRITVMRILGLKQSPESLT